MTNYIEEMMKTAGVEITRQCKKPTDAYCYECDLFVNDKCTSPEIIYCPDFTPEKQLEIIKLIGGFSLEIYRTKGIYYLKTGIVYPCIAGDKDFTQALAQLTTELMKAGELDKGKVKEILE